MIQNGILASWADKYETSEFIKHDPIMFPRQYQEKKDIEISAVLTSWIAYGNRKAIIKTARLLDDEMGGTPYMFIKNCGYNKWFNDENSFYRFFKYKDLYMLCARLHNIYEHNVTLEDCLAGCIKLNGVNLTKALQITFNGIVGIPVQLGCSACKRLVMLQRWLVRKNSPVDIGIWSLVSTEDLLIPLDVHVHSISLELGLTKRRSADMKTAIEITNYFKNIFPHDPSRGDFSLFGKDIEMR